MPTHTALSGDLCDVPVLERGSQYIKVNLEITPKCDFVAHVFHKRIKFYMSGEYQNGHYLIAKSKRFSMKVKWSFFTF